MLFKSHRLAAATPDPLGSLLGILREKYTTDPDTLLMICPYGIGDTYFASGLVQHVLKARGRKKLSVLCAPQQRFIPKLFNASYEAHTLPEWLDVRILKESGPLPENILYAHFQTSEAVNLIGFKGVTLLDAYRGLFNLPLDTPFPTPKLVGSDDRKRVKEFFAQHKLQVGKTALLAPEAVSVGEFGPEFWHKLATKLRSKGYNVVLNSDKFKADIPHDTTLGTLDLDRIPAVAEAAGLVVSLRSGLCDLLSSVDCRLVVMYPDVQWHGGKMIDATGLRAMGISKTAEEIVLTNQAAALKAIV